MWIWAGPKSKSISCTLLSSVPYKFFENGRVSVNPNPKMMLSTAFPSSHQTLKPPLFPHLKINSLSRLSLQTPNQIVPSSFCFANSHSLQPRQTSSCLGFSGNKRFGFLFNRQLRFSVNADKGGNVESKNNIDEVDRLARSESTMPERFRYLTKEAPDPPVRWPWFVGKSTELGFRD